MKKLKIIGAILCIVFIAASCKKENSVVKGKLTYIHAITGVEYNASETPISITYNLNTEPANTVITDSDGNFQFSNLSEGVWFLSASKTASGLDYSGVTTTFNTDGKNTVTMNLVME